MAVGDVPASAGLATPAKFGIARTAAAWAVHAYTASGVAIAFLALHAIVQDGFVDAFRWLVLAFAIDSSDGTLARAAQVKRVLPQFDGTKLDDIVDYLTYTVVPIFLLHHAGLLPAGTAGLVVAAAPLLASAYGFCRTDAKTEDHYFRGFPSYWNVFAFYAYALPLSPTATAGWLLVLSVLVFAPLKFLYPSRASRFRASSIGFGLVWAAVMIFAIWTVPATPRWILWASLAYPLYYTVVSFYVQATER